MGFRAQKPTEQSGAVASQMALLLCPPCGKDIRTQVGSLAETVKSVYDLDEGPDSRL